MTEKATQDDAQPTVAIVGASDDPTRFSNRSLRAHLACGYRVFPVHPRGGEVEGLRVHASVAEAPVDRFDRVSMYVRPKIGLTLLEEIAKKGCAELWLNPGAESEVIVRRAEELGSNPIVACSLVDCQSRGSSDR